ncbi:hypothetical protein PUNSTDRAFT_138284 [Punctularia strigosozonata HHB-11173 SS5]|uniref:Cytochrome b561 domain-containing protein n=1 Tax=Punctularia strigosozonata (strain HHB-11173) TaxID=741275 RepID=R7S4B0_PUNST|nr:uncharacterized protein PUNSTDRAFT_138284 [Punctularia strigosozonata HHB-11173 SS5]EIN04632.1 hypothetical protein PUNSTDRAFT_138284 [Punctularia strigosozonata HHB-11173 SS5]
MSSPTSSLPLTPIEEHARIHAHLMTLGFLALLPAGILVARYFRTFTRRWWFGHTLIQAIVSGPVIIAGFVYGYQSTQRLFTGGHWNDPHKKIGLALFILYLVQLVIGLSIHYFKPSPTFFKGRRPPQNYFHALFGLAIVALASYQVHYGMFIEWARSTGNLHPVAMGCKHFWLGCTTVFFGLYFIGVALFLRRQYRQEAVARDKTLNGNGAYGDGESGRGLTKQQKV